MDNQHQQQQYPFAEDDYGVAWGEVQEAVQEPGPAARERGPSPVLGIGLGIDMALRDDFG